MITKENSRLCGGTFLILMLRAKRTRAKKEIRKFGNGGVTNPELLKSLIMFIDPDYIAPAGTSLETNTSLYKSCDISHSDCLPLNDTAMVNAFDRKIQTAYKNELATMNHLADFFLTTEKPAKMQELVYGILNLIKDDESIKPQDTFYALPNGKAISKAELNGLTDINLYALLLGVWHFILLNRKDNTIGKPTIAEWHRPPTEKGDKHTFISTIGESYHFDIKISTICEHTDDAEETAVDYDGTPTNDYVDAEIIEEMATPQPTPAITQNVQNQFNINQSGNGINIGYAEKVEIRDGKVVTLK